MRCLQECIARIKLDDTVDKTHAHTQARTHARKGIYVISLIIFKRKVKEGNDEWFKPMKNLIRECIGVVAHLIRIWKYEFHCTQGLLPVSFNGSDLPFCNFIVLFSIMTRK